MKLKRNLTPTAIILYSLIIAGITYVFQNEVLDSPAFEPVEHIENYSAKELSKLSSTLDPYEKVEVGLFIKNFSQFSLHKNEVSFDGTIWFKFDDSQISKKTIEDFSIENGKISQKTEVDFKKVDDKIFVAYDIHVETYQNLNFFFYPFNSHRVKIAIINNKASHKEIILETNNNNLTLESKNLTSGWELADKFVNYGYATSKLGTEKSTKPIAIFYLDCIKSNYKQASLIIHPLLLILFVALLIFSIKQEDVYLTIWRLAGGSLTMIFSYRFIIESMKSNPNVDYMTISSYIFNFCLISILGIFLISVINKNNHLIPKIIALLTILISYVTLCFYLLKGGLW